MKKIPLKVAKEAGCTHWMIKKINAGGRPSVKLAIKIADAMNNDDAPRLVEMIPELKRAFEIMIRQGVG